MRAAPRRLGRRVTRLIDWQDLPHDGGAFKLDYPGRDPRISGSTISS
jgi:hypothetical protein